MFATQAGYTKSPEGFYGLVMILPAEFQENFQYCCGWSISDECGSGYSKMNRIHVQEIEEHSVTVIVEPKNTVIAARDKR